MRLGLKIGDFNSRTLSKQNGLKSKLHCVVDIQHTEEQKTVQQCIVCAVKLQ